MSSGSTIDVALTCTAWRRLCPTAERLTSEAARLSVVQGMAQLGFAPTAPVELSVVLSGAAAQQQLNRDYRGRDGPTNVLAFPAWHPAARLPPDAPILLGDVVLACETVAREALEQDKSFADHLRHLVVHGVLHLLGFDHLTAPEAETMESLEISILAKLGVADPYTGWPRVAGLVDHE